MADHIVRRPSADDSVTSRERNTTTELSPDALQQLLRDNARLTLDELDAAVDAATRARDEPLASGSLSNAPRWAHTFRRDARDEEVSTIAMPRLARSSIDPADRADHASDEHAATRPIPLALGLVESSGATPADATAGDDVRIPDIEISEPEILIEISAEVGVIDGEHDSVAILDSPPLRTRPPSDPAYAMTQPIPVVPDEAPILLEPAMKIARAPRTMPTMKVESLRRLPVVSMQVLTPPPGLPLQRPASTIDPRPVRVAPDPPFTRSVSRREPRILAPLTRKLPRYVVHRFAAPRVALVLALVLAACYWYVR